METTRQRTIMKTSARSRQVTRSNKPGISTLIHMAHSNGLHNLNRVEKNYVPRSGIGTTVKLVTDNA